MKSKHHTRLTLTGWVGICALLILSALPTPSWAQTVTDSMVGANKLCPNLPGGGLNVGPGSFSTNTVNNPMTGQKQVNMVDKIVTCLTAPAPAGDPYPYLAAGAVPRVVGMFMGSPIVAGFAWGLSVAVMTLAVSFFGIKLAFGLQASQAKRETVVLLLKMGGVFYFLQEGYGIYAQLLGVMRELYNLITQVTLNALPSGFCANLVTASLAPGQYSMWLVWDCITDRIIAFSDSHLVLQSGIIGLLMALLMTGGWGFLVFFSGLFFILGLFFTVVRVIHIYMLSAIGVGFMFCLGFLFLPLIFFKSTMPYFRKWLQLIVGYLLTPILLYAYLAFAVVAIDRVVFTGDNSLYYAIGGTTSQQSNFTVGNAVNDQISVGKSMMVDVNLNPGQTPAQQSVVNSGMVGSIAQSAPTQSSADAATPGLVTMRIDLPAVAANTTFNAGVKKTTSDYLKDILIAMLASVLLVYILYSLLSYIPSLAADLAHGGSFQQGSLARERAVGEQSVRLTAKLLRDLPMEAAKGFATGGYAGAAAAAARVGGNFAANMAKNAPGEIRG